MILYVFQITRDALRERRKVSKEVKELLKSPEQVQYKTKYVLVLPSVDAHKYHSIGSVSLFKINCLLTAQWIINGYRMS